MTIPQHAGGPGPAQPRTLHKVASAGTDSVSPDTDETEQGKPAWRPKRGRRGVAEWRVAVFKSRQITEKTRVYLLLLAEHMDPGKRTVTVARSSLAAELGVSERSITTRQQEAILTGFLIRRGAPRKGVSPATYEAMFPTAGEVADRKAAHASRKAATTGEQRETYRSPRETVATPAGDQAHSGKDGVPTMSEDQTDRGKDGVPAITPTLGTRNLPPITGDSGNHGVPACSNPRPTGTAHADPATGLTSDTGTAPAAPTNGPVVPPQSTTENRLGKKEQAPAPAVPSSLPVPAPSNNGWSTGKSAIHPCPDCGDGIPAHWTRCGPCAHANGIRLREAASA